MESFCEDLKHAVKHTPTTQNLIIGNFNAQLEIEETETAVDSYSYEQRNEKDEMFLGFFDSKRPFRKRQFFLKKSPQSGLGSK